MSNSLFNKIGIRIPSVFIAFAVTMIVALIAMWVIGIKPYIEKTTQYHYDILSQVFVDEIEKIIDTNGGDQLDSYLTNLIVLRDKETEIPIFASISIRLLNEKPVIKSHKEHQLKDVLIIKSPLFSNISKRLQGSLEIAFNKTQVQVLRKRAANTLLFVVMALIGLLLLVSIYIKRELTPLKKLAQNVRAIDVDNPIAGQKSKLMPAYEINQVEVAFNTLIEKLIQRNSELSASKITSEEALREKLKMEMMMESKNKLLGLFSHEFRTPLNSIITLCNLINGGASNEKQKEYILAITKSSKMLHELINHSIDYAQIESDEITLNNASFSIKTTIDEINAIIQQDIVDKKIIYRYQLSDSMPPYLYGDELRIKQILLNILFNAVKFTQCGTVDLNVDYVDKKLHIMVRDTGIGIPSGKQALIFQPYKQHSASIKQNYGGAGLGLVVTKQLVDLMGGAIDVESEINKGTIFTVVIDVEKSARVAVKHDAMIPIRNKARRYNILLAEDNDMNCYVMEEMFQHENVNLTMVNTGKEAIYELDKNLYDVCIMDMQMPVMDGYDATHYHKTHSPSPVPIIILTADISNQTRIKCNTVADAIEIKPVEMDKLMHTIRILVEQNNAVNDTINAGIINPAILLNIYKSSNDLSKAGRLLGQYDINVRQLISDVEHTIRFENSADIAKKLHKLKGSCSIVGATAMAEYISAIKAEMVEEKNVTGLVEKLGQLHTLTLKALQSAISGI